MPANRRTWSCPTRRPVCRARGCAASARAGARRHDRAVGVRSTNLARARRKRRVIDIPHGSMSMSTASSLFSSLPSIQFCARFELELDASLVGLRRQLDGMSLKRDRMPIHRTPRESASRCRPSTARPSGWLAGHRTVRRPRRPRWTAARGIRRNTRSCRARARAGRTRRRTLQRRRNTSRRRIRVDARFDAVDRQDALCQPRSCSTRSPQRAAERQQRKSRRAGCPAERDFRVGRGFNWRDRARRPRRSRRRGCPRRRGRGHHLHVNLRLIPSGFRPVSPV